LGLAEDDAEQDGEAAGHAVEVPGRTPTAPEKRYGSVLTESCSGGDALVEQPESAVSVAALLRRIFPAEHPGVTVMTAWLEEESVVTAAQLRRLLEGEGGVGGSAALQRLGFRADWAEACVGGFNRASALAAREV